MSEQQGLAEVMGCSSGDPDCGCDSAHDARHVLASRWLRAHDDRIRAEERERMVADIDAYAKSESERVQWDGTPGLLGNWLGGIHEGVNVIQGDRAAALRAAAGTPTHDDQNEGT